MRHAEGAPPLRVALVQLKPRKADVCANLEVVRRTLDRLAGRTDLAVFPEASLSGYFLEGGVAEVALSAEEVARRLGRPPAGVPDVALGFYERWRRRPYNSAAYLSPDGEGWTVRHVHRKLFLPSYGVFDEDRFVEAGAEVRAFDTRFGRMGLLVCEDMWHSLPATILALEGAELLVTVSASPARDFAAGGGGRTGNLDRWERLAPGTAAEHGVFVVVAQLVGSEGGKLFPGGSLAVGPDGSVLARGPLLDEGITEVALEGRAIDRIRYAAPHLADLERMLPHLTRSLERAASGTATGPRSPSTARPSAPEAPPARHPAEATPAGAEEDGAPDGARARGEAGGAAGSVPPLPTALADARALDLDLPLVERALVEFIREEFGRRGFERAVVGVSGGVDSAVALYLACRALGPENVWGFRLPYRTSSPESLEHARLAIEATGARCRTVDISESVDRYVEAHEPDISPLRRGNLMARLRAVVLFDQSARLGALPLGTGNKSERLLGYFTWHADDSPPVNPLGDLFKTQVWALARHLGVPDAIADKPATADLVRGVTDEDELGVGYHDADPVLHGLLIGYTPAELARAGFAPGVVDVVERRLRSTHWKRELPTVALLSSSAIGAFYLRPVDY